MTGAMIKGNNSIANSTIEALPRPQTTYVIVPTGGVIAPIMTLRTKNTPKMNQNS